MNFKEEIFKAVQDMVDMAVANNRADITYESVIKDITPKGYVVLDRFGSERTVQCCIPNLELKKFQKIWLKEPMGDLKKIHICGVIENTSNSNSDRRR